jgi:hypothetical protein
MDVSLGYDMAGLQSRADGRAHAQEFPRLEIAQQLAMSSEDRKSSMVPLTAFSSMFIKCGDTVFAMSLSSSPCSISSGRIEARGRSC